MIWVCQQWYVCFPFRKKSLMSVELIRIVVHTEPSQMFWEVTITMESTMHNSVLKMRIVILFHDKLLTHCHMQGINCSSVFVHVNTRHSANTVTKPFQWLVGVQNKSFPFNLIPFQIAWGRKVHRDSCKDSILSVTLIWNTPFIWELMEFSSAKSQWNDKGGQFLILSSCQTTYRLYRAT